MCCERWALGTQRDKSRRGRKMMTWMLAVPMPWPLLDFSPLAWTGYRTPVSRADAATKHHCDSSGVTMSPWGLPVPSLCRVPVPTLQVPSAWLCACRRFPGLENCGAGGLKASCRCCLSSDPGQREGEGRSLLKAAALKLPVLGCVGLATLLGIPCKAVSPESP